MNYKRQVGGLGVAQQVLLHAFYGLQVVITQPAQTRGSYQCILALQVLM